MSSFLIVFDRERGKLLQMQAIDSAKEADTERVELELKYRFDKSIEIVVLEASSEDQLRSTHARYFGAVGLEDLAKAATGRN